MPFAERAASRRGALLGVTTLALLIVLDLPVTKLFVTGNSLVAQVQREAFYWGATALVLAYVKFIERRPLSTIGLRAPNWKTIVFGVIGAAVMTAGIAFIYLVAFPVLHLTMNVGVMNSVKSLPLWFRIALVVRAAVFEEIFYRGFAIERLTELTGLRWLAVTISLAAFTLAHLDTWGWAQLVVAGFGGIVLTGLYVWRRDLVSNMLAHFLTDAVGFLLA